MNYSAILLIFHILVGTCLIQCNGYNKLEVYCSPDNDNQLILNSQDQTGYILSKNYPNLVDHPDSCTVHVTVCSECKMMISIQELLLPECNKPIEEQGSCIYGCDHIYLHEQDSPEQTTSYIFKTTSSQNYSRETTTRRLYFKFCRSSSFNPSKFKLKVEVLEKVEGPIVIGSTDIPAVITSPYFPDEYMNYYGDDTYRYIFENQNIGSFLNMTFTDWNLHPESSIKIYEQAGWNSSSLIKNIQGNQKRPFVSSNSSQLFVEFLTGKGDIYSVPHDPQSGFRAEIVATDQRDTRIYRDCGQYYKDVWGGSFTIDDNTPCPSNGYLNCIFVIAKMSSQDCFTNFFLRFDGIDLEMDNVLTIKQGSTSQGPVIGQYFGVHIHEPLTFTDFDSYYIHFKGSCHYLGRRFKAVFASYRDFGLGMCTIRSSFQCADQTMHLPANLVCDGVQHCKDGSDEMTCATTVLTSRTICENYELRHCSRSRDTYCPHQLCDGIDNCPYGDDEIACASVTLPGDSSRHFAYSWGTVVPVTLVCVVIAFIMCLLISMYSRMRQGRAARAARQEALGRHGNIIGSPLSNLPNMMDNEVRMLMDCPPSYDNAVYHNTPQPPPCYTGFPNLGYTSTSSQGQEFDAPPPYFPPKNLLQTLSIESSNNSVLPNQNPANSTDIVVYENPPVNMVLHDRSEQPSSNIQPLGLPVTVDAGHPLNYETGNRGLNNIPALDLERHKEILKYDKDINQSIDSRELVPELVGEENVITDAISARLQNSSTDECASSVTETTV